MIDEVAREWLEAFPDPTFLCDGEGCVLAVNAGARVFFPFNEAERPELASLALVGTSSEICRAAFRDALRSNERGHTLLSSTLVTCRAHGAAPLMRELTLRRAGAYVVASLRDVRAKATRVDVPNERGQLTARESDTLLEQVASQIQGVFWTAAADASDIYYASPGFEKIWGRSVDALYRDPKLWTETIHEEDRARVLACYQRGISAPEDVSYRIVHADGTVRWIRARVFPIRDAGGTVIRIAGLAEDMTERRETELQLQQTQKLDAMGRVAAGVAHDYNNVLSVVLSCATYVARGLGSEHPLAGDLETIVQAGERAVGLTRQLLAFSRRQRLEPKRVDLNAVVRELERLLEVVVREDVNVELRLAPKLPPIVADATQLEQIILNLVVNARDATPRAGRIIISTSTATLEAARAHALGVRAGRYVALSVRDTGTGMDRATLSRIFEPFFTTKPRDKGTGLGLATVFGIVKQSGGGIHVWSEPGCGADFTVYLPRANGVLSEAPRGSVSDLPRGNETILVVEDEAHVRGIARAILTRAGYKVLVASTPAGGLDLVRQHEGAIDLLLTDVVMPQMNGLELARKLMATRPGLKVLCMSGYAEGEDVAAALREGMSFLQKPLTPSILSRKVRAVLSQGAATAKAER